MSQFMYLNLFKTYISTYIFVLSQTSDYVLILYEKKPISYRIYWWQC